MQSWNGTTLYSASDLVGFLECEHSTTLALMDLATPLQRATDDESAGELAVTHYRVLRRWPDVTLVEVRLETGRRNQIRVHFAEMGHPVVGEPVVTWLWGGCGASWGWLCPPAARLTEGWRLIAGTPTQYDVRRFHACALYRQDRSPP